MELVDATSYESLLRNCIIYCPAIEEVLAVEG